MGRWGFRRFLGATAKQLVAGLQANSLLIAQRWAGRPSHMASWLLCWWTGKPACQALRVAVRFVAHPSASLPIYWRRVPQRGPRRTHGGASHRAPVDCFPLVSPASRLSPILIRTPIISVVCAPRGALPLRRRRRGSTERLYGCRSRRDARSRRRNETGACRCPPRLLAARWEQGASATRAWSKPTAKMGDQDPTTTREDAGLRRKAKKDLGGGKDQASP